MKNYRITINGKTYEVGVEECEGGAQVKSVQPTTAVSPAPEPKVPAPKATVPKAPETPKAAQPSGAGDVTAPMPGTVLSVNVSEGQQVKQGQLLLVFEAMKMENELLAPCSGTVQKIHVSKGTVLETGTLLVSIG